MKHTDSEAIRHKERVEAYFLLDFLFLFYQEKRYERNIKYEMDSTYDKHVFRLCVKDARRIIEEKDEISKSATSLLAELLYEYTSINKIPIRTITWEDVLKNNSSWVDYYDEDEKRFNKIKTLIIRKIDHEIEENKFSL
ncbi:hypothetical protein [Flagellimonas zhangzhouensis]|uniref:hypothetical protein n=1 Tax=Flagellimonas zhangzhouensis TaxID=1073328 RepID=UPI000B7D5005|nr:hypothetical protein [Allomuricauda zhangzhouensis]